MKLFTCCLLILPFAAMVATAPVRARRENVLSFLTDELEKTRTTEKVIPASTTGYRNPPSKPVTEEDSDDMSEAKSAESFATNGFKGAVRDPDSHEIMIPTNLEKVKAPSRRNTGGEKESVGLMAPHRQASEEWPDFHSEEEVMADARGFKRFPGKQVTHSRGDKVTGSASRGANLQTKTGRVDGMLAQGESGELLDRDSLEDTNAKLVPQGNRDTDYDETREYKSSETYVLAPAEHKPSSLAGPAKSQTS